MVPQFLGVNMSLAKEKDTLDIQSIKICLAGTRLVRVARRKMARLGSRDHPSASARRAEAV